MKANELSCKDLMIGDWVMINPISYYQVEQIRVEFGELRIYLKGTEVFATENEIMPIPVTPEILEKNGFTCDENIAKLVERDDTNNILWSAKYSFFTGMIEVVNKITDEKVKVRCYSVHELQHIFRLLEIEKEIII